MLVLPVPIDFYKLFQYSGLTSIAVLSESSRVVIVTVDSAIMLIVAVRCTENCWTNRAGEMLDMVFMIQGCDI
jgi:hypothetical protein